MAYAIGDQVLVLESEKYGSMATPSTITGEAFRFSPDQPLRYPVESILAHSTHVLGHSTEAELVADTPENRAASQDRVAIARHAAVIRRPWREARIATLRAELAELEHEDHYLDAGSKSNQELRADLKEGPEDA
jgi:hypothetical protein